MICFPKGHGGLQPCSGAWAARWLSSHRPHRPLRQGEAALSSRGCFRQPLTEKAAVSQKPTPLLTRNNFTMRIFKAGRSGTPINQEWLAQYRSRARASCRPRAHGHVTLQCHYMQTHRRRGPGTVSTLHVSRGIATLPGCSLCTLAMLASGQQRRPASAVSAVLLVTSLLLPEHSAAAELATPSPGWHVFVSSDVRIQI